MKYLLSALFFFLLNMATASNTEAINPASITIFTDLLSDCEELINHEPYTNMNFTGSYFKTHIDDGYYGNNASEQLHFNTYARLAVCVLKQSYTKNILNTHNIEQAINFIAFMRQKAAEKQGDNNAHHFGLIRTKFGFLTTILINNRLAFGDRYLQEINNWNKSNLYLECNVKASLPNMEQKIENTVIFTDSLFKVLPNSLAPIAESVYSELNIENFNRINTPLSVIAISKKHIYTFENGILELKKASFAQSFQESNNREKIVIITHAPPESYPNSFVILGKLFDQLMLKKDEPLKFIAASHWILAGLTPHLRGGGAVAEWWSVALMSIFFTDQQFISWKNTESWAAAVSQPFFIFNKEYSNIFCVK